MTNDEMRVVLAGWANGLSKECIAGYNESHDPDAMAWHQYFAVPNFPESLDAVATLEARLTGPEWDRYTDELDRITRKEPTALPWKDMNPSRVIDAFLVHAKADQKCRALVASLNLSL